eukprot:CAMPEP_0116879286 /NCGR_PEP_ID=MMETSP0463-20121206/11086_1 /TAXON_ID=181622 /ORGANISM="Strombidinopsis sp, Strain SopsisLIS2011" /LENGTH=64 /DNA_ID=CAMNT_0004528455 /DNA_START=17 /DNA_END=211 /DNA_ORIENTATION=-
MVTKSGCSVALAVVALFGSAEAANPVKTAIGRNTEDPRLQDCEPWCLYENDDNSWCLNTTPPMF